jgi:hypothetical protein
LWRGGVGWRGGSYPNRIARDFSSVSLSVVLCCISVRLDTTGVGVSKDGKTMAKVQGGAK